MTTNLEQPDTRLRDVERETSGLSRAYEHLATKPTWSGRSGRFWPVC